MSIIALDLINSAVKSRYYHPQFQVWINKWLAWVLFRVNMKQDQDPTSPFRRLLWLGKTGSSGKDLKNPCLLIYLMYKLKKRRKTIFLDSKQLNGESTGITLSLQLAGKERSHLQCCHNGDRVPCPAFHVKGELVRQNPSRIFSWSKGLSQAYCCILYSDALKSLDLSHLSQVH